VRGLTICDTTGMAHPAQVARRGRGAAARALPALQLTLHFHNTRGMGLANLLAAVQEGIDRFDGSLGGLGGCPYAPGATGNICSEDAIHMLTPWASTPASTCPLLAAARQLPAIVGHDVPGQVAKAGRITDLHPAPSHVAELSRNHMIDHLDHLVLTTARSRLRGLLHPRAGHDSSSFRRRHAARGTPGLQVRQPEDQPARAGPRVRAQGAPAGARCAGPVLHRQSIPLDEVIARLHAAPGPSSKAR
jgi:hypothetical protein